MEGEGVGGSFVKWGNEGTSGLMGGMGEVGGKLSRRLASVILIDDHASGYAEVLIAGRNKIIILRILEDFLKHRLSPIVCSMLKLPNVKGWEEGLFESLVSSRYRVPAGA